ncbi:hypothetical protein [Plantactinospora sp. CA-290183]|uniref:hypothetical protein n=1 Tax=Plantactinospora sp. CA-290183 TaxID=3240006 RepID=UPI003D9022A7
MTTRSDDSADDAFWRRPTGPSAGSPADSPTPDPSAPGSPAPASPLGGAPASPASRYPGPPPSSTPPPGWRPPVHVQPPPPRRLPAQDLAALDAAEDSARTLTYGIGMVGAAALVLVICLLCSRVLV